MTQVVTPTSAELPAAAGITAQDLRRACGQFATGVTVVTVRDGAGLRGMTANSFTSVSLDPPLVAFLPDKGSSTWPRIEAAAKFCVNVLASDQEQLCRQFAARGIDKFAGVSHRLSVNGSPVLDGVLAWIDCRLHAVHEAGDHFIALGEVIELDIARAGQPLLFFRGKYGAFAPHDFG